MSLKKCLLAAGISLAFIAAGWPSAALAEETNTNTATADTTSDQTATSGSAEINTEVPVEAVPGPETIQETPVPVVAETTETTATEPQATTEITPTQPESTPAAPSCLAEPTTGSQPAVEESANPALGGYGGQTDTNNSTIDNNLCSTATSGNATVTNTENGGNATTGEAEAIATILNVINSVTGLSGGDLVAFIQNVYGDQFGDLLIDPSLLGNLPTEGCDNLCLAKIILNSNTNSTINNDITMSSNSGNADVSNNGLGGNATSGDATTLLNLVNIINSIITTGQSFIGIINIYGNLDGDILLPPELLESLLNPDAGNSSGAPPGKHPSLVLDNNVTQSINNNLNLNATSGNATVSGNDGVGNAISGNASTSLKVINLTGSQIIGSNALLVFINVLGTWLGLIVNAPVGATSAMLGAQSSVCQTCLGNVRADINTSAQINNNINLSATSGNATVTNNGGGSNATSGNASTSLNLVNIMNSYISLANWFGILFINVFGTWNGSFGIDTSAGEPPEPIQAAPATPVSQAAITSKNKKSKKVSLVYGVSQIQEEVELGGQVGNVLGNFAGFSGPTSPSGQSGLNLWPTLAAGILSCALLAGLKRRKDDEAELIQTTPEIIYPQAL